MRVLVALLLFVVLAGCATVPDRNEMALKTLPEHYRNFDAVISWEIHNSPGGAVIDGVLKNVRYAYMDDVEVRAALLDERGNQLSRSVDFVIPSRIPMDDAAPFTVELKRPVHPGSRVEFTYSYRPNEGGERGLGDGRWYQSFDWEVPPR